MTACNKSELTEPENGGAADYPVDLPPDTIENVYMFRGHMFKVDTLVWFGANLSIGDSSNNYYIEVLDTLKVDDSIFTSVNLYLDVDLLYNFPIQYVPDKIYRFEIVVHDTTHDIDSRLIFYEKTPDVDSFLIVAPDSAYSTDTITVELSLYGTPHIRDTFWVWVYGNLAHYCEDFKLPSTATEFTYDLSRCASQHPDDESVGFIIFYSPIHRFPSLHEDDFGYSSLFWLGLAEATEVFLKDRTQ